MQSAYPQPFESNAKMNSQIHSIANNSKVFTIELSKTNTLNKHRVTLDITQNFSVAPTSFDSSKVLERIQVKLPSGYLVDLDGYEVITQSRYVTNYVLEEKTLGLASRARFCLDIDYINEAAKLDLATALHTHELGKGFALILTFTDSLGFVGGTPSVYTVANPAAVPPVLAQPATNQTVVIDIDSHFMEDYNKSEAVGLFYRKRASFTKTLTGAGVQDIIPLKQEGQVRFVFLTFYGLDAANVKTPMDTIMSEVVLLKNEKPVRNYEAFELKSDMYTNRAGFTRAGTYVIDMGEDEHAWLDTVNTPYALQITSALGSPAKWMVSITPDQVITKDKLL